MKNQKAVTARQGEGAGLTMAVTDPMAIIGFVVFDWNGEEVGEVEGVLMGAEAPEWAVLLLPAGRYVLVPMADADIYEDSLDLPFTARPGRRCPPPAAGAG